MPTEEQVYEALEEVIDPELGLDFVSLGLVYEVDVVGTRARVTYTLTAMGCPVAAQIEHDITTAALEVDGIERVDPELVFIPPWSPDRMNEDAKFVLGFGV